MPFLFKNYLLVKVICLLIRCYKTRFFLWNTINTDENGVNKQNTHTHHTHTQREREREKEREKHTEKGSVSIKISDTPSFLKQPPLFYQPLPFYGKYLNPTFSQRFQKLIKRGRGSPIMTFLSKQSHVKPKLFLFISNICLFFSVA